ncbi:mCG144523, partial [Mus musculus]
TNIPEHITHVVSCCNEDLERLSKLRVKGFKFGTTAPQWKLEEVDPSEKALCHWKVTSKEVLGPQSLSAVRGITVKIALTFKETGTFAGLQRQCE